MEDRPRSENLTLKNNDKKEHRQVTTEDCLSKV